MTHKKFHGIASHKFHRLLLPRILRKSHLILCNSIQTKGDVNNFVSGIEEKVEIIQLGISDYFKPSFDASIIKKLKINSPFLLHVGTLEPRKNIPLLIEAFTELKKTEPSSDLQLILAGKPGWDFQEILASKKSSPFSDSIILTDFVTKKELRVLYTHAECLVMPSYHEGFGLPVLEAMACGCPCLISGEGALKEVGGEAAIYFDIHNINSLIDQTQQLLANKENQLKWREKALNHAKKYSWKNTALSFMRSIENLTSFS